ncbi:FxsB family cyclophane-forming radical SAM/SPASM peptide maturase [Nocardia cyriacigeorgica]|uniref:FxsB family cyclophane-forming radical SAM/SPASM peptide maturase n=1 Tax=Nocardia cyriacigeorgica TaxID=135487 RepID=UPI003EE1679A
MDSNSQPVHLAMPGRPWPDTGLDIGQLRAKGWTPLPFTQFVVKIHSRCNLACDYCYVYEMADQSWQDQPVVMTEEVFTESCRIIGEHARAHGLTSVGLVFHGGEPLLAGHTRLATFARRAREMLQPITELHLGMQTNGVLLDEQFLGICDRWDIQIGVSIDGDERGHDRHRRYRRGTGSYHDVVRGIELVRRREFRHLYSGLLCTIDTANDPIETYAGLVKFAPPAIDLLLPHGNWNSPPPAKDITSTATPYADWLIPIFDRWFDAPVLETRVRLFDEIIELLLGGQGAAESVGLAPMRLAVIETDGTLEQVDALKSAFAGAAKIRGTTGDNPLDNALWEPAMVARQIGADALCDTCRNCPLHTVCGGGHYAHRYRPDTGFRNPSVYCGDLTALIHHIGARVHGQLTAAAGPGAEP